MDIVVFQEVRTNFQTGENQMEYLKTLFPTDSYSYNTFQRASVIQNTAQEEGISVFSKFRVASNDTIRRLELSSHPKDPDPNRRIAWGATFELKEGKYLDLITTHFSVIDNFKNF